MATRREETVQLFVARMQRWQHVQAAAFAVGGVGFIAYLGEGLPLRWFVLVLLVSTLAVVVSAGVQAAYEEDFSRDMGVLRLHSESLKRRGSNP